MPDQTILHLDTTTNRLHLALSRNGEVLSQLCQPCESHRYHSAVIVPAIQDMLKQTSLTSGDLTALAVNQGPGSFTGIRTGIITARTMAQFLRIPVYTFNIFELLATQTDNTVAVYLDALRNRAYHASLSLGPEGPVYRQEATLRLLQPEEPPVHTEDLLVSPSLASIFKDSAVRLIPEDFSPIQPMLDLIHRYGERFERQWEDVKPLYSQEPSITLKKKPVSKPSLNA